MRRMITFDADRVRFTNRIVGIAFDDDRVLLHRTDNMNYWALPGGRAELMEPSTETLRREMREELDVEVEVDRLVWVAENFFKDGLRLYHEVGFYFLMHLPIDSPLRARTTPFYGHEGNMPILFEWHPVDSLENLILYPTFLRTGLKDLPTSTVHIVHMDGE